jgi:uncharacterized SAM-dependent methyltransferase
VGIDISGTALIAAQQNLQAQVEGLVGTSSLTFIEDDNLRGIERARAMFPDDCFCILWMGSSIGNFDHDHAISLLQQVRQTVGPNCLFFLCTGKPFPMESKPFLAPKLSLFFCVPGSYF